MKPQENVSVSEIELFTYWVENDNLLVTISKAVERTMENAPEFIELLQRLVKKNGGKKICILSDVTNIEPLSKEMREYFDEVVAAYVSAVAMFSNSKMGSAMAFIYTTMHGNMFEVKVCNDEQEGRAWLKDYLSPNPSVKKKAEMDEGPDMLFE